MASVNRFCFHLFNLLLFIGALGIITVSFFLYTHLYKITSLLDGNYNLNANFKFWIPAAPWICFSAAVSVCFTPICGFMCTLKKSRNFLILYTVVLTLGILLLTSAAVVVFQYVDENSTHHFISNAVRHLFDMSRRNEEIEIGFSNIEESLYCCGAEYGDYNNFGAFSKACCDGRECGIDDVLAREKMGCSKVAAVKTIKYVTIMYATTFATSIVGVFAVIFAIITIKRLKRNVKINSVEVQQENDLNSMVKEKKMSINYIKSSDLHSVVEEKENIHIKA